jgi:RNA polymerase sigma-70 factor (ECF subfamily)
MAPTGTDEQQLVRLAQAGDLKAFEALVRAYEAPMRRYVGRLAGASVADDVLQETFVRVWSGLRWLDEPQVFRAWIYRIATREALRVLKRESRREEVHVDETLLAQLVGEFREPTLRRDMERYLAQISPAARVVVAAHYFDELPLGEVSVICGVPLGTVKSRLASGLAQLRTLIRSS